MPVELPVRFGMGLQVRALVVGVPAQGLGLGEAARLRQAHLGGELDLFPRLAPYDRPDVGLGDAHDAIFAPVRFVRVHLPLLVVHGLYDPEVPQHFPGIGFSLNRSSIRFMLRTLRSTQLRW